MSIITRQRKSEKLTASEKTAFKKWVDGHVTLTDARESLGVAKATLDRLLLTSSGHPDTIARIREKISIKA